MNYTMYTRYYIHLGWKKFNETGDAAVQSPDQPKVDKVKADAAIAALNDINSR